MITYVSFSYSITILSIIELLFFEYLWKFSVILTWLINLSRRDCTVFNVVLQSESFKLNKDNFQFQYIEPNHEVHKLDQESNKSTPEVLCEVYVRTVKSYTRKTVSLSDEICVMNHRIIVPTISCKVRSHVISFDNLAKYRVRNYRGRVSNFDQSESRKHCFLASDWLKFETLPR